MTTRVPTGGVGSNQYAQKGTSQAAPRTAQSAAVAAVFVSDDLSGLEPWERVPVEAVPLFGGYVAKSCATKTQNDLDPRLVGQEDPDPPSLVLLGEQGLDYERSVFANIKNAHPGTVHIEDGERDVQQKQTLEAMQAGAPVIINGFLPDDESNRRTGKPDALVRVDDPSGNGTFGYMSVDVKHHTLAGKSEKASDTMDVADLATPNQFTAEKNRAVKRDYLESDGMQLAHYQRMLEDMGFAAPGAAVGGIIDKDGRIWKVPLDTKTMNRGKESLLERYDREYETRMRIARQQIARNDDDNVPSPRPPVRCGDCSTCKWRTACAGKMKEADHVSLVPGMPTDRAIKLGEVGLGTRAAFARLDPTTARLVGAKVDTESLLLAAQQAAPGTPVAQLMARKPSQSAHVIAEGINTSDDVLARIDPTTSKHASGTTYAGLIEQARAATSGRAWRAHDAPSTPPRRATVEIHLDMESSAGGRVYLWGARTHDRRDGTSDYRPSVDWNPDLTDQHEAELLAAAWQHMGEQAQRAAAANKDVAIVVYTRAEKTQMRRIAAANDAAGRPVKSCPTVAAIDTLTSSDRWIDAFDETTSRVVTGEGASLKTVAPLAGFNWSDAGTTGDESMVLHEAAVRSENRAVRESMQRRILRYNSEDTAATAAVLDFLEGPATLLPSIDSWTP